MERLLGKGIQMNQKITFHSKIKQNIGSQHVPEPSKSAIPEWFSSADKHKKMPNGLYELSFVLKDGKQTVERVLSWKSCPALLDAVISGYVLKTPVDIKIDKVDGKPFISNIEECSYFCNMRGYQEGLPTPYGYEDLQLQWITNWVPQVPAGYTTMWTHPLNRFDLPFISISGFVDTESYTQRGKLPFFIKKDFQGTIPAGTPFVQIFPIKSESWEMDLKVYTEEEIKENDQKDYKATHRQDSSRSSYKKSFWVKKQYD
jgi:hypothetical protein